MSDTITATPRQQAEQLHQYIVAQSKIMGQSISEIGRSLKLMRDDKLYTELGHESFEDYTIQQLQLKQRQAYNYIQVFESLGSTFVENHAQLGITKLLMLADVPTAEREDFALDNKVDELTVKQLQELTDKFTQQSEQLSLALAGKESAEEAADSLQNRVNELETRPIDVAVQQPTDKDIDKIREQERKKLLKEQATVIKAAVDKATEKAEEDKKKAVATATKQAADDAEKKLRDSLTKAEQERATALERATELEGKLSLAANNEILVVNMLFEELQRTITKIADNVTALEKRDSDTGGKLRKAAQAMLEQLRGLL